jgi:two-component system chemotaxis response regulator CheY
MSHNILTVDDSRMVRKIVAKTFEPFGCEILEASTGAEGLATAEAALPHLIFLDITMADMNGLVVLEKMRAIASLQATPVIMLTAESGNNSIARADRLKAVGYIAKPFKPDQLLTMANLIFKLEPVAAA